MSPARFNPFNKEPPLDEKFANFEPQAAAAVTAKQEPQKSVDSPRVCSLFYFFTFQSPFGLFYFRNTTTTVNKSVFNETFLPKNVCPLETKYVLLLNYITNQMENQCLLQIDRPGS